MHICRTWPVLVKYFYDNYNDFQMYFGNDNKYFWNFNEHNIALGICINKRVLGPSEMNSIYLQVPKN